jgi:hypothetical protein
MEIKKEKNKKMRQEDLGTTSFCYFGLDLIVF